jgi:uncharacterized protein
MRNVPTKVLLPLAVILVINVPGLVRGLVQVNAPAAPSAAVAAPRAPVASGNLTPQQQFDIKSRGSVGELLRMNLTDMVPRKWSHQVRTGRGWMTFGLFLLGLCAGRAQLFRDTAENRAFFRRLLPVSGAVALITTAIAVLKPFSPAANTTVGVLANFSFNVQWAALSAFYVAALTLLFWRRPEGGLLPQLAPLGKMGLSTYLMQTVFGVTLFLGIGFGMLGRMGTTAAVAAGIAFFVLQIFFSRWWMARFGMGPVEWLWRAATYFTWRPKELRTLPAS